MTLVGENASIFERLLSEAWGLMHLPKIPNLFSRGVKGRVRFQPWLKIPHLQFRENSLLGAA